MTTWFADTFFFIAFLAREDRWHQRAVEIVRRSQGRFVTTAWVLTEVADGMAPAGTRSDFGRLLRTLQSDPDVKIIPATQGLFDRGVRLYLNRPDKDWSLTDCITFVVMEEEGIIEALTGDHHFEQAGFVALLK